MENSIMKIGVGAKVLVLGGTGAMGIYLVPELLKLGYKVSVTSRSKKESSDDNLVYLQGDAHNTDFLNKVFNENRYDAIIDFMVYSTKDFKFRYELLLKNTNHYIYLSSYRVFADSELAISESSPRLLDVSKDKRYLKTDEYALSKARQEDVLRNSQFKNWTIVRPTITYSTNRFQLGTLEADLVLFRTFHKPSLPLMLPKEMLNKKTTMTWAGDVAKMLAALVLNSKALMEDFNVCTDETYLWQEVADIYNELIGLQVVPVSIKKYLLIARRYQTIYDRMFNRVMDNSKIMSLMENVDYCKSHSLMGLRDGLRLELENISKEKTSFKIDYAKNAHIDRILKTHIALTNASKKDKQIYYLNYYRILFPVRKSLQLLKKIKNKLIK